MNTSKDSRLYAYLAAVCYIVSAFCRIVDFVIYSFSLSFNSIVLMIICIIFSVALLLRNEKVLLGAMVLNVLYYLYRLINYFYIGNLLDLAASIILLVIALSILTSKYSFEFFWYIPAILSIVSYIIGIFGPAIFG